ncbi:MAG: hypothetical protein ACI8ZO_000225 [Flavobacteriales bacterium]|jgi:hypothetical protein
MKKQLLLTVFVLGGLLALPQSSSAQLFKKKNKSTSGRVDPIDKLIDSSKTIEGLFNLYQKNTDGSLLMEIQKEQIGKEFIYFSYVEDGVLDAGFHRGSFRGSKIFSIQRYFDRIELVYENTSYYFDPENPLSKASGANINRAVMASLPIKAVNGDSSKFIVSVDELFMSESLQQIKRAARPGSKSFTLGNLSKSKNKYSEIRNYPQNTDVIVEYVYENKAPKNYGGQAVTDARYVTVKLQHSFIAVPENNFVPRRDDPRVGYFMTQVNDMTTFKSHNYKDMIHRWNLVKKNPSDAISEPVEPIKWWIENTTPLEYRQIIKDGIESWNTSFEKAGFKNAMVAEIQPDDADWDAGDIRYNVIRWTSSPRPPFGGYGPSFVNPRTGQILGADIMIEFVSVTNRLRTKKALQGDINDPHLCAAGEVLHQELQVGLSMMQAMDLDASAKEKLVQETLYRLMLHEVGHTLGLNHNMKASSWLSYEDVIDPKKNEELGLCASVMDYPSINFRPLKEQQGKYYDSKPGPYDHWAIEYAYSAGESDPATEEKRLSKILARSAEPGHLFGNDADDMRGSGRGIDPRVNIYDLSNDPVRYAVGRLEMIKETLPKLKDKFVTEGESYGNLRMAHNILMREWGISNRVISRQIGGVYVERDFAGLNGVNKPYTPVPYGVQKEAMDALSTYAFAPNAINIDGDLMQYLQLQRRGFNHFSETEDPRIHKTVIAMQSDVLNHFFHTTVQQRILDSEFYGNTYVLSEVMRDLTDAIFKADAYKNVNSIRVNLQTEYTQRLIKQMDAKGYNQSSKALAYAELNRIKSMLRVSSKQDKLTIAHKEYLNHLIEDTMSNN